MEHEQMTYPEALRWLANKYHIEIVERELSDAEKEEQSNRESMFIINEFALKYFQDTLHNTPDGVAIGMQYFRQRGIRDDIIREFQLGFDPNDRLAFARTAQQKGYKPEFIEKVGICYKNERGELIDRYAGRVIFPWIGVSGKVVGFGGRKLDAATKGVQQKYVNSPDSDIYHKDRELYGLYQAKRDIAKEDCVYMVEGYTDVIAMHQAGIKNVVANSGTALSLHQIHILRRFTQNIILLYDGDSAGIHAALRGTDMLLAEGMNLKVLLLPDGDDPDSFARKHTASDFKQYIEEHQTDFIQFKTDLLLRNERDPLKRSEAINSIVKSISVVQNPILRDTYLHDCAQRIGINEATLINQMNRFIRDAKDNKQQSGDNSEQQPIQEAPAVEQGARTPGITDNTGASEKVERMIVQMIIKYGEQVIFENVETEDGKTTNLTVAQFFAFNLGEDGLRFSNELFNRILDEATEKCTENGTKAETYFINHEDIKISQIAVELSEDQFHLTESRQPRMDVETLQQQAMHLVLDFRMDYLDKRLKEIRKEIANAQNNAERTRELMTEFMEKSQMRNALATKIGSNIIL